MSKSPVCQFKSKGLPKREATHDAQRVVLEKELVDGETRVQRLEASLSEVSGRVCGVGC